MSQAAVNFMILTSHLAPDNMGEDPPPLCLDLLEGSPVQLPSDYANYANGYSGDIKLSETDKELAMRILD
jgi:hypothetical protein